MKTRRPCVYADIRPDKGGRIIMRKDKAYRCTYPDPELPKLPASITDAYGFKWPPSRNSVWKEICSECPCYKERGTAELNKEGTGE